MEVLGGVVSGIASATRATGRFLWRNKGRIVLVGAVAGVGYAGYTITQKRREFEELMEELRKLEEGAEQAVDAKAKAQEHFRATQASAQAVLAGHLASTKGALMSHIDLEALTEQLAGVKNKREKKEVWERLKLLDFTRTLVALHVFVLLHLLLRTQLHLIGRNVLLQKVPRAPQRRGGGSVRARHACVAARSTRPTASPRL